MSEAAQTLGQRLKLEREKQGLSTQKAADELHLDPWAVDALESGDYARVGPSVYVKGHLKRYAGLLGLPAAEMIEALEAQSTAVMPPAKSANLRMRTSAGGGGLPWAPIVGFVAAALIVAGVMWWRPWHPRFAAQSATAAPAEIAASSATAVAEPAAPETSGDEGSSTAATALSDGVARNAAAPAGPGDADAAAGQGRARLRLSFSADSWVDVHDASGARVYSGNGRANSVKTIAGAAPLRVYLKSASGVQLEINNRAVAIGRQFVAGDVARFEAGADGVLRRDAHAATTSGATTPAEPAAPHPRG